MKKIIKVFYDNRIISIICMGFAMILSVYISSPNILIKSIMYILWVIVLILDFVLERVSTKNIKFNIIKKSFFVIFIFFILVIIASYIM